MLARVAAIPLLLVSLASASIITDVRTALRDGNFRQAEALITKYRSQYGVTPEMIVAQSWLGRTALATKNLDQAEKYAAATKALATEQLKTHKLDADPDSPLAIGLGAAIEVQAQSLAARGERAEAVDYLRKELAIYRNTSIRTRIQKNINLLSMEGKPAPPLESKNYLGPKPPTLASLRGRPVLLFFWAHWCSDCKQEIEVVAQLKKEYASKGLAVIGPTRLYGYAEGGREVGAAEELAYIEKVRRQYYVPLLDIPSPVSEENFRIYGSSSSPTLVLIDRQGLVKMFHPGSMSVAELRAQLEN